MTDIGQLLRDARPAAPSDDLAAAAAAVAREVQATPAPLQGKALQEKALRRRATIAGVSAAAFLLTGGAAAAAYLGAHTGEQVPELHEGDSSERIDPCAKDFGQVLREFRPQRALPPGLTWSAVDRHVQEFHAEPCGTEVPAASSEASIRATYTFSITDGWVVSYLRAAQRHDRAAMGRAAAELERTAKSPEVLRVVEDGESAPYYDQVADAAERGDVAWVQERYPVETDGWLEGVR